MRAWGFSLPPRPGSLPPHGSLSACFGTPRPMEAYASDWWAVLVQTHRPPTRYGEPRLCESVWGYVPRGPALEVVHGGSATPRPVLGATLLRLAWPASPWG
eukprot:scaffold3941_cov412-Prasinococcus_capsulatus_cf.AAC.7